MVSVTVVYQSFNQDKFIHKSLEGILNQTHKPEEIIIIDDCSDDISANILLDYERKYKNIELIINKKNKGTASNSNFGIDNAKGDLIYFAAADDYAFPTLLEEAVKAFRLNKNLGLFSADINTINSKGEIIEENNKNTIEELIIYEISQSIKKMENNKFWVTGQTCVWKKDYLIKNNLRLYEDLKHYMDHFLIINIVSRYPVAYLNKTLASWRLIQNSYSDINFNLNYALPAFENLKNKLDEFTMNTKIDNRALNRIKDNYLNHLFLNTLQKQRKQMNVLKNYIKNNNPKKFNLLIVLTIISSYFNYLLYIVEKIKLKLFR